MRYPTSSPFTQTHKTLLRFSSCIIGIAALLLISCQQEPSLTHEQIRVSWQESEEGWKLAALEGKNEAGAWKAFGKPSGAYTFLYAPNAAQFERDTVIYNSVGKEFPDPIFKYTTRKWQSAMNPIALNQAGKEVTFFPSSLEKQAGQFIFQQETPEATLIATWQVAADAPADLLVNICLIAKANGFFSIVSPSLASVEAADLGWATVPGFFQGNTIQANIIPSVAYAQGLPSLPYVAYDHTVTTPAAILEQQDNNTLSVILEPEQTRALWATNEDRNTHRESRTGFSHQNRQGALSPTAYVPILSHPDAQLAPGDTLKASFRYHLSAEGWFSSLQYIMAEVYKVSETLALKKPQQSLTRRMARLLDYSLDDETSFWREMRFEGEPLGAQLYMGGVVGSQRDATKNSDIGAMWMMADLTQNQELKDRRLPLVRNFKLLQQEPKAGFFHGAARGQYYLFKSKKWVEEWGSHIEPIGITYYTLADLGNILLFQPEDQELKAAFQAGAERLLEWQQADGSWVIGYDHQTEVPVYTDLQDLRPTFYGLMIAYRVLGEEKYLAAAKKGADWLLTNSVAKGHFLGVCGDARFLNDFATGQMAQAFYDLWELTGEEKYKAAAIATAKMYVPSIYSHPIPDTQTRRVKGKSLQGWEYTEAGLSFEHGGSSGSAVTQGPILLASHAGMFVRIARETGNPFFAELARAAAWGRDAHVNPTTSVASYYWAQMDRGAGSFPHHAWWQIGWLMDYLMAEASYRSEGEVQFPSGFMTAKVGPHKPYGFEAGRVCGDSAALIFRPEMIKGLPASTDLLMAKSLTSNSLYLMLIQNSTDAAKLSLEIDTSDLLQVGEQHIGLWDLHSKSFIAKNSLTKQVALSIDGKGIQILKISQ